MLDKPVYVTPKGLADLKAELKHLSEVRRPEIGERLHEAKAGSDWMDNTDYMLIEEELVFVDRRIYELEHMLANVSLIEPDDDDSTVNLGDTAVIQADGSELERYTIVGVAEANPSAGLISNESPLGRALLRRKVGEEVMVEAPAGSFRVRIVAIT